MTCNWSSCLRWRDEEEEFLTSGYQRLRLSRGAGADGGVTCSCGSAGDEEEDLSTDHPSEIGRFLEQRRMIELCVRVCVCVRASVCEDE